MDEFDFPNLYITPPNEITPQSTGEFKFNGRNLRRYAIKDLKDKPNQARFFCRLCSTAFPLTYGVWSRPENGDYDWHCKDCVYHHRLEKE